MGAPVKAQVTRTSASIVLISFLLKQGVSVTLGLTSWLARLLVNPWDPPLSSFPALWHSAMPGI